MNKEEQEEEEDKCYYTGMDYYSLDMQQQQQQNNHHFMKQQQSQMESSAKTTASNNQGLMVDYMLNSNSVHQPPPQQQIITSAASGFGTPTSLDRLNFAKVMQFVDFGPKLALNQQHTISSKIFSSDDEETTGGIDPVYFLKFPVLSNRLLQEDINHQHYHHPPAQVPTSNEVELQADKFNINGEEVEEEEEAEEDTHHHNRIDSHDDIGNINSSVRHNRVVGGGNKIISNTNEGIITKNTNNRRKRPRSVKTGEEVESQRMTHIAVERNRRKQMNEHLKVLRSLMPGSYVQRGDQASIIGGAIKFVRELEQLLQCLESQKRRRLFGSSTATNNNVQSRPLSDQSSSSPSVMLLPHQLPRGAAPPPTQLYPPPPPLTTTTTSTLPNNDSLKHNIDNFEVLPAVMLGLREETAENKSCLADVEVKLIGHDAMIKILSRRRPGQLLKTIAALEDLQLTILHTNITTIEQTVLYSFNVKVGTSNQTLSRFTAEDIASSVQQIFNFIYSSTSTSNSNSTV